jgi:hypothetical protein
MTIGPWLRRLFSPKALSVLSPSSETETGRGSTERG